MGSLAEGVRSSAIPAKQSRIRRVSKQSRLSEECARATMGHRIGARTVQADAKRTCSLFAAPESVGTCTNQTFLGLRSNSPTLFQKLLRGRENGAVDDA
jgi:hypothetical protein